MPSLTEPSVHSALLLVSLICLGVWIFAFKIQAERWRFELFAVDFALGTFLFSLGAALLFGNLGTDLPFNDRLLVSSRTAQALMLVAGLIFGVGNTLFLGAVSLLGTAGAFAIAGGVALAIGTMLNRANLNLSSFLVATALFLAAALFSVWACRLADPQKRAVKGQPLGPIRLSRSTRGIIVATLGGTAIYLSYPLALRGAFDDFGLGPYAGLFLFCAGVLLVNIVFSLYFFNIALEGGALKLGTYLGYWPARHLPGIIGGAIWGSGALAVLLARISLPLDANPATNSNLVSSYLPLGSIPLAMVLGLVFWREFAKAPKAGTLLVSLSTLAIAAGITALAFGTSVH